MGQSSPGKDLIINDISIPHIGHFSDRFSDLRWYWFAALAFSGFRIASITSLPPVAIAQNDEWPRVQVHDPH